MSMSRTALKLVQKSLPQLHLCKSILVLPPTQRLVRGYQFERTQLKGTFYLWRRVTPLFRVTLSYSTRIAGGYHVYLSKENPHESAAEITRVISEDLPNLEKVRTPSDFLAHVSWMIGNDSPIFLFDLALTYFLVGRCDDALLTLEQSVASMERLDAGKEQSYFYCPSIPHREVFRSTAEAFAAALRSSPARAAEIISDWERRNIAQYGLEETILTCQPRITSESSC